MVVVAGLSERSRLDVTVSAEHRAEERLIPIRKRIGTRSGAVHAGPTSRQGVDVHRRATCGRIFVTDERCGVTSEDRGWSVIGRRFGDNRVAT